MSDVTPGGATPTIRILEERLINRIAAGEIVERPASVVKELVENALDAGAGRIDIETKQGGKQLIAVSDDGHGMDRENALLAMERHATSKIASEKDLSKIHTLGFRGEALPSIASVSRCVLITKSSSDETGTEIAINGGTVEYVRDAGRDVGTSIRVHDLFLAVPARRKFLKTDRTEHYHILDVVHCMALSRPDVRFRLVADGKEVLNAHTGSLRDRAGHIVGKGPAGRMSDVSFEADGVRIIGLAGAPEDTRSTRTGMFLFVNDRFVTDQMVNNAIMRAYHGMLGAGRYPQMILFIQISPEEVDVNIHPAKQAVKFSKPNIVHGVVSRAVGEALRGSFQVTPVSSMGDYHKSDTPLVTLERKPGVGEEGGTYRTGGPGGAAGELFRAGGNISGLRGAAQRAWPMDEGTHPGLDDEAQTPAVAMDDVVTEIAGDYVILGQVLETYIVLAVKDGIVILDQHAAHERIVYERLRQGRRTGDVPKQTLLFPVTLELSRAQKAILIDHQGEIGRLGMTISDFGCDAVVIESVPADLSESDVSSVLQEMIAELKEGRGAGDDMERVYDRLTALMACHGAIRAGKKLTTGEIEALITDLTALPTGSRCPHGRPTSIMLTERELLERFKRIP
ncbi:MAG: DNA mismatch repair endonuclease MutL [Deltaproteobacteria bacterium]|nr:DNA mismatch repair endonuclease MutL [Candidatus Zymogenaceae bacterium]